ncbi:MAG: leucine-rich repeat domain-containing protein [Treponema sp.]|nr:leucine-rich repeat domain-containing protein [Treponema sp.]
MKKVIMVLLAAAVGLTVTACLTVYAQNESDFESRVENGRLVLIGYRGNGGNVVIPARLQGSPVTAIADKVFQSKNLTSVSIPKKVTTIEFGAFYNNRLTRVNMPNSVTAIEQGAFMNNQLTRMNIPNSVTTIEGGVYE